MEAKNTGRITVKMLSEMFEKEVKGLKEMVKVLEKRLNESDVKVKQLEEKVGVKEKELAKCAEKEIKCKACEKIFDKETYITEIIKKFI